MKIPFVKPDITDREIAAVTEVLKSGWITTGPVTKEFEKNLASYIDVEKTACLNSQTAGAELLLRLLDIGPGDEVILPAYTYTATCSVVYHVGATPVLIDSQENSPEMDYDLMEAAITDKTKLIMPVDLAGIPCDYPRIFQAVENKKSLFKPKPGSRYQSLFDRVIVQADTAHSLGASQGGVKAGKLADFSSFSFHAIKNLTTAEGGAVSWRPHPGLSAEEFYRDLMLYSLHGQTKDALAKSRVGDWEYDIVDPLYKCNLTDLGAAIGNAQLKRYPEMLARRWEIIRHYDSAFKDLPLTTLDHFKAGQESSGHLYFIRLQGFSEADRNDFIVQMAERGVNCNVHYKPLPLLTAYRKRGFDPENYPKACAYYANMVSLPLYSSLSDAELDHVVTSVRSILA